MPDSRLLSSYVLVPRTSRSPDLHLVPTVSPQSPPGTPPFQKICEKVEIQNGYFYESENRFNLSEEATYRCQIGYTTPEGNEVGKTQCLQKRWIPFPKCINVTCGAPPEVTNATIVNNEEGRYLPGASVQYKCQEGFESMGLNDVICEDGEWSQPPTCQDVTCGAPPEVTNATIVNNEEGRYLPGARVQYKCQEGFESMGLNDVICEDGEWSQPPTCQDVTCGAPPEVTNATVVNNEEGRYLPGASVQYKCQEGFESMGLNDVICEDGEWSQSPTCQEAAGKCGYPPAIDNGEIMVFPQEEYEPGSKVEYRCQRFYRMNGSASVSCESGQWTDPPVCLEPCTTSPEVMEKNNIRLRWRTEMKLYLESGAFIEFDCKNGYVSNLPSSAFRVQCVEGKLAYPKCKRSELCITSPEDMEKNNIGLKWSLETRLNLESGDFVEFDCKNGYVRDPTSSAFRVQCVEGKLAYPKCKRRGTYE
ncbi:unnamed protein product [Natator depressus]